MRFLLLILYALLLPIVARANGISVTTDFAYDITGREASVRGKVAAGVADATVYVETGTTPELGQLQTVAVVPDPQVGSSTKSPGSVAINTQR